MNQKLQQNPFIALLLHKHLFTLQHYKKRLTGLSLGCEIKKCLCKSVNAMNIKQLQHTESQFVLIDFVLKWFSFLATLNSTEESLTALFLLSGHLLEHKAATVQKKHSPQSTVHK